jgi:hypothetical protein
MMAPYRIENYVEMGTNLHKTAKMLISRAKLHPSGPGVVPALLILNALLLSSILCYQYSSSRSAGPTSSTGSRDDVVTALRSQIEALLNMRVDYGELYCKLHGIGPTGGFCVNSTADVGGNTAWDSAVCARLSKLFAAKTVLDFGCGLGHYGRCLQSAGTGIHWTGYDGSEGIEKATGVK